MKHIKLFEQYGEDWNKKLLYYSKNGDLNGVIKSIEHGANVNCKNNNGWTPLHISSRNGHLDIVKYLIEHSADVNCKDNDDWTPLHLSLREGYLDIVKHLIEHGADWFIKNDDNEYFMDLLSYKNKNIIKKLYPDKYKEYEMRIEMDKYNL